MSHIGMRHVTHMNASCTYISGDNECSTHAARSRSIPRRTGRTASVDSAGNRRHFSPLIIEYSGTNVPAYLYCILPITAAAYDIIPYDIGHYMI